MRFHTVQRMTATTGASPAIYPVGSVRDVLVLDQDTSTNYNSYIYHISVYAAGLTPSDDGVLVLLRPTDQSGSPTSITGERLSRSLTTHGISVAVSYGNGTSSYNINYLCIAALNYYNPSVVWDFPMGQEIGLMNTSFILANDDLSVSILPLTADIEVIANVFWAGG